MGPSEKQMDKAVQFLLGTGVLAGQLSFASLCESNAMDWWPGRGYEFPLFRLILT